MEKLGHNETGDSGGASSAAKAHWPQWDEALTVDDQVTVVVQVNGKIREKITVDAGTDKAALEKQALALPATQKWLENQTVVKVIVVPDKLVNIVVKG